VQHLNDNPARNSVHVRHATHLPRHRISHSIIVALAAFAGFALVLLQTNLFLVNGAIDKQNISGLIGPTSAPRDIDNDGIADIAAGDAVNILLLGSDVRDGENGLIGGVVGGMRSDTTIIMHISADRSRVEFVSIPRDSRVKISDCQFFDGSTARGWTTKFNTAFSIGAANGNVAEAAACTAKTIYDLTGLLVDHYAVVDFTGFRDMVDAIDGVPMCIVNDVRSSKAQLDLQAGPQVLDGTQALAFARARTGTGLGDGSDLGRIERQQELMRNTLRKVLGMNLFTDATGLTQFVKAGASSLSTDETLGNVSFMVGLAYSLRNFDTANLQMITVPWAYPGDGSGDVVWTEEADALWAALINDRPVPNPDAEPSPTPTPTPVPSGTPEPSPTGPGTPGTPDPEPSVTPSPLRETEQDILDSCDI
jgi:LCP family protein required for cell wall assembly